MKRLFISIGAIALLPTVISGCSTGEEGNTTAATTTTGTLALVANGEDFVRQGFVTKDGWQVDFDRVEVTLEEATAYITEPAFDPETETEIKPQEQVALVSEPTTIDLAEGGEDAEPISVTQIEAPVGSYNALSWQLGTNPDSSIPEQTIELGGTATKDNQTIDFVIGIDRPLNYTCGEFVGDERKGIVQEGDMAEVEMTFHFDHLFGDESLSQDDPLNAGALGFQPLADLANNGNLEVDSATLEQQLSPEEYQTWQEAIAGLGHVGEGHCRLQES